MATIIILATIGFGGVILGDSTLSFLGFGVPPRYPSWGRSASTCWAVPFAMSWTRDCAVREALLDALDSASAEG